MFDYKKTILTIGIIFSLTLNSSEQSSTEIAFQSPAEDIPLDDLFYVDIEEDSTYPTTEKAPFFTKNTASTAGYIDYEEESDDDDSDDTDSEDCSDLEEDYPNKKQRL